MLPSKTKPEVPPERVALYIPKEVVQRLRLKLMQETGSPNISHWVRAQILKFLSATSEPEGVVLARNEARHLAEAHMKNESSGINLWNFYCTSIAKNVMTFDEFAQLYRERCLELGFKER